MHNSARPLSSANRPDTHQAKVCLLVLGMHRSGTSAITRVISLLGAELPRNLLGANSSNPAGHWEPLPLIALHDAMLAEAGSRWDDWLPLDLARLPRNRSEHYRAEIARILRQEYGKAPLVVLKEPRISRFVPFYRSILEELGYDVRYIHIRRDPLAVAASLEARDRLSEPFSKLVWLRHELDAEAATRGGQRVFLSYGQLLGNWRDVMRRIAAAHRLPWPPAEDRTAEIDAFLDPHHRHHAQKFEDVATGAGADPWIEAAEAAFRRLQANPADPVPMSELDRVRRALDASADRVGPAFAGEFQTRLRRLAAVTEERNVLAKKSEHLSDQLTDLSACLAAVRKERDDLAARNAGLSNEVAQLVDRQENYARALAEARKGKGIIKLAIRAQNLLERDRLLTALKGSDLFDADFYARSYPDVSGSGVDPFDHYLMYGFLEGRDPSEAFSTSGYLSMYPDVKESGINPLKHYLATGRFEGRARIDREGAVHVPPAARRRRIGAILRMARKNPDLVRRFWDELRRGGFGHALRLAERKTSFGEAGWMTARGRLLNAELAAVLSAREKEYSKKTREQNYARWIETVEPTLLPDGHRAQDILHSLTMTPTFSVIMPVYKSDLRYLREAVESVRRQSYPHWQLCLVDDASETPELLEYLADLPSLDDRIAVKLREKNGHISAASNDAIKMATGDYLCFVDHDDTVHEHALLLLAGKIAENPSLNLVYSDQDKIDPAGRRYDPYFKPAFDPDLLRSQNYVDHLATMRTELVRQLGGLRIGFEGSQDYDLVLRVVDASKPTQIGHLPYVLYHWRAAPGSIAASPDEKDYAPAKSRQALRSHLERNGLVAHVQAAFPTYSIHRVVYPLPETAPRVSVVIPTRDNLALLKECVDGVLIGTDYEETEIIIVDNASREAATKRYLEFLQMEGIARVVPFSEDFNYSRMNNLAVREVQGNLLCFLNNDVRPVTADWLEEMVRHAIRPEIGAVGARLLYETGHVQHSGVILGYRDIAGHAFRYLPHEAMGPWAQPRLTQNFLAVTAACMVVRKELFERVGGFDETNLPIVFNDIDLCLRIRAAGYRNLITPHAELVHYESLTRGTRASEEEYAYFRGRWRTLIDADPYFNPNLSREHESFLLPTG